MAVSSLPNCAPSAPIAMYSTPFWALNQCRQGTLSSRNRYRSASFKRKGFRGLYTSGNASTLNLAASVSRSMISPMSMFQIKLAKDLYGTILGTLHFFMNSVLLFLDFLALSFTTSEVFRILVYFFLLIRTP